jgi:hypothetical protein
MDVPPALLHEILLSPRIEEVPVQSISKTPTPEFQMYQKELLEHHSTTTTTTTQSAIVLKRAFHDRILESVLTERQLTPSLRELLVELHQKLRNLVPNRKDLHVRLQDDRPDLGLSETTTFLKWIIEAGQALSMLESQVESVTTVSWKVQATNMVMSLETMAPTEQVSFLICSLFYLIDKTDRTQQEKDAFTFYTVVLPQLFHTEKGYQLERNYMIQRYPRFDWPITRMWIRSLTSDMPDNERKYLIDNRQRRAELVARGWIDSIVFGKHQLGIRMPELFYLDGNTLQAIRKVTSLAAAGCALGLHATQMANKSPEMMRESDAEALIQVMKPSVLTSNGTSYETAVEDTIVGLVKEWKENDALSLTEAETEMLRHQSRNVLRGEDPVLQLLDKRMQKVFGDLALEYIQQGGESKDLPVEMHSGATKQRSDHGLPKTAFALRAQSLFSSQGLTLFAKELVQATELAARVPVLACQLYDNEIRDIFVSDRSLDTPNTIH